MKLRVGDRVHYELSPYRTPRWCSNLDYGSTGEWEEATVIYVYYDRLDTINKSGRVYQWPLPGHPDFKEDQWDRAGYLQKIYGTTVNKRKCVCGAHSTPNPNLHASWCDLA
jgi:hypothetical protein